MRVSFGFVFHFKLVKLSITFTMRKSELREKSKQSNVLTYFWSGHAVIVGI